MPIRIRGMSDDLTKRTVQDRSKVSLSEEYEVQYWKEKFDCSKEELEKAVKAVGNGAKMVEDYFSERK